jgi:hypothetical protein
MGDGVAVRELNGVADCDRHLTRHVAVLRDRHGYDFRAGGTDDDERQCRRGDDQELAHQMFSLGVWQR